MYRNGITIVAALMLTVLLASTAPASVYYKFDVIAETGQADLTGIGDSPSINDNGMVAFVGQLAGGENLFVGDGAAPPRKLRSVESSTVTFGRAVQINNSNQVVARDLVAATPGFPARTRVRIWDGNAIDANVIIARGGLGEDFDATIANEFSINNNGDIVFAARTGTQNFLVTPKILRELPERSSFNQSTPLSIPLRPMIADNGRVVVRAGNKTTDPILLCAKDLASFEVIADTNMGFIELGGSPGISDELGGSPGIRDARLIVVFYANLNAAGAAILKTTPGPGIFASIDKGNGTRVIQRIAGIANNGFLDPGETFTDTIRN